MQSDYDGHQLGLWRIPGDAGSEWLQVDKVRGDCSIRAERVEIASAEAQLYKIEGTLKEKGFVEDIVSKISSHPGDKETGEFMMIVLTKSGYSGKIVLTMFANNQAKSPFQAIISGQHQSR